MKMWTALLLAVIMVLMVVPNVFAADSFDTQIGDVFYNNTNGEISIWISYNAAGTDTNLATLEADFLVAGYSNGKLIRVASKKDFEMKKKYSCN